MFLVPFIVELSLVLKCLLCTISSVYHFYFLVNVQEKQFIYQSINVNLHDRGGLSKVNKEVICIFTAAEYHFISLGKKSSHIINCKEIVDTL